jgi:hypothetical protein
MHVALLNVLVLDSRAAARATEPRHNRSAIAGAAPCKHVWDTTQMQFSFKVRSLGQVKSNMVR